MLAFAPLTALAGWKAPTPVTRAGYLILTATLATAAVILWVHERRMNAAREIDLNVRAYHARLLQLYDRRIRFLKSVKYWYAIPLFVGASLVCFPILTRLLPSNWGVVLVVALIVAAWIAV